ncbi:MAG: hypothetical protein WAP51_03480, partial [Candidatus Sungiibacteriota bacterium]
GSMYKFKQVPVLRLKVVSRWRTVSGKLTGEYSTEMLDEKKSILPACGNARWVADRLFSDRQYALMLPGFWDGKYWSWGQHSAIWLVTENGEDIPIVHNENSRFWSFTSNGHNPRLQFKILSPLERFCPGHSDWGGSLFARMELRRREDEDGGSVVELRFAENGETNVLMDTTKNKNDLVTLVYALNDKSGWREKLLARTIVALRKELAEETTEVKFLKDGLTDCKIRREGLRLANLRFFNEAIRRFDATKAASRHKMFADFRKLLEVGYKYLAKTPTPENMELLGGLRSDINDIPSHLK